MSTDNFTAVHAAAVDGRASNIFYRLSQLEKLHNGLVGTSAKVQEAIIADSRCTSDEARFEYSLALGALRERYKELDYAVALEEEYRVAKGQSAETLREGFGLVAIRPAEHTLVFSIIAPLAAAIAAGNCVVIQLSQSSSHIAQVLGVVLRKSLDPDSFAIAIGSIPSSISESVSLEIQQDIQMAGPPLMSQIISPRSRVIAVVDRTANYEEAAQALIAARFSYRGRSPFAPDIVLVNEFVKRDLVQALSRKKAVFQDTGVLLADHGKRVALDEQHFKTFLSGYGSKEKVNLITQDTSGAILDVVRRSRTLLQDKIDEPCLIIHGVKSLDDAIDLLHTDDPYAAAYLFGSPGSTKYLSQYINSQVAFVNHIPPNLLVGPTFPLHHEINSKDRYPTALFSKPAPVFTKINSDSTNLIDALSQSSSRTDSAYIAKLYRDAIANLPIKKRRKQIRAGFGFFEQAFLMHFGSAAMLTIGGVSLGVWWLRNKGIPHLRL